jgi:ATP-dependent DNA helicase RecG
MPAHGQPASTLWSQLGYREATSLYWHYPRRYEDRRHCVDPFTADAGTPVVIRGRIEAVKFSRWRGGRVCFEATLVPEGRIDGLSLIWYNMPYLKTYLKEGKELFVYGKLVEHSKGLRMIHPEFEMIKSGEDEQIHLNRITPIYRLSGKVRQKALRREIYRLLQEEDLEVTEPYPVPDGMPSLPEAIRNIHFPESMDERERARQRLAFDELFFMQLALLKRRRTVEAMTKVRGPAEYDLTGPFLSGLSFQLTDAQQRVMAELDDDLSRPYPMNRLLQGDVGAGKTLVATYALLKEMERGCNGALMAPTETLALQHYQNLKALLKDCPLEVVLMTSSHKDSEGGLFSKGPTLFVGTHALFQEGADLGRLGIGVVDEQHKFGVLQRQRFLQKGEHPDLLVMTATPIPRTLCLTQYGDLDVSVLDELPPGRKEIRTVLRKHADLPKVWDYIRKEMSQGRQAYIVYPLLEESEKMDLRSVKNAFKELQGVFGRDQVVMLHGQMSPEEKAEAMEAFASGQRGVMVATTVIEVGVDVRQATMMVIEHADRFGLAQLHQLRGRVGRGGDQSYCVLVADPKTPEAEERLKVMEQTNDGFVIAEEDYRLRGPGDIIGTQQSGDQWRLRLANVIRDHALLQQARRCAESVLDGDPTLEAHPEILKRFEIMGLEHGVEAAN